MSFSRPGQNSSSYFVPAQPRKTQVFTYKREFLTYEGSFRMEKDDKPSTYDTF